MSIEKFSSWGWRNYDANFIIFSDSLLNGVQERLVAFAEQLLKDSRDIQWAGFMRAQMDSDTAALLARAGCHDVFIGIESFSDKTLELMNKRRTKADNVQAIQALLDADIGVTVGFVPGFPSDTRDRFIRSTTVLQDLQEKYPGQLEVNVEPFLVQPNAPIYSRLEEMGLSARPWANEYLDLAPRYLNITSEILCTVEGDCQGVERLGRLNIVKTIMTDEPLRSVYSFQDGDEETLSVHEFDFDHIYGGWYLAQKKSLAGYTYSLLVNQDERKEIEELQGIYSLVALTNRRTISVLSHLERLHVVPPSRKRPGVVRSFYRRDDDPSYKYTVSPFVVARAMDWRDNRAILIVNYVSGRWYRRPPKHLALIKYVATEPRTERQLRRFASGPQCPLDRDQLRGVMRALVEDGIFGVCDERKRRNSS